MKRPRVRFTVRMMRIAVAVVALVMEVESIRRAWVHRRMLAGWYARAERNERDKAIEVAEAIAQGRRDLGGVVENTLAQADCSAKNRRGWEAAAARPWDPRTPVPIPFQKPGPR